ncbi:ABC-type transport system, periplasmic component [Halorhabdus sp. SVX81]|uniref:hypothetical protein n=1 Tax=Halorhabdus sp. SVX81 TaxID=2978283 RepID=UPI0023DB24BD|nr:hypothetical protein [Halorhabdus sp. SVX81]WEL18583.1 ABC-type transport system, periplasmic component [Halorhabdus sp. SVX81]
MRRPNNPLDELSRRQYVQAIVAASVAGVAGCGDDGSGNNTGEENGNGGTDEGGEEPVSQTFNVVDNNVLEQANMSTWQTGDASTGKNWMTELSSARTQEIDIIIDGHTYSMPHVDGLEEVEIPAMITDYTAEPPYDMYNTYNQDLYYWDEETPIDAEARVEHDYVYYGYDGLIFNADEAFKSEAVEQFRHHFWYNDGTRRLEPRNSNAPTGESELPDDGTNAYVMQSDTVEGVAQTEAMPMHPSFTTPYAEKYADTANQEAMTEVTNELEGDSISVGRYADEGWGGGPYKIESSDDVSGTEVLMKLREDHPNDHINIPELRIQFATEDRAQIVRSRGQVDLENGVLPESTGSINRQSVPDHIQEISRWLQVGGDNLIFNFNNKHLGRLWVRRAAVAAIDWNQVGANGWGPEVSETNPHHTGLLETVSEGNFDDEFLDSLYTYPIEADQELAAEWMRKAGYEKQSGSWVGPDGDSPDWDLTFNSGESSWIGGVQTVMANLEDFGLGVTLDGQAWDTYTDRLSPPDYDYDIALQWANFQTITGAYDYNGAWWSNPLLSGSPDTAPYFDIQDENEVDGLGRPVQEVPLPSEVGSIEAPDGSFKVPDSIPGGADTYDMKTVTENLREPGIDIEEVRNRAKVAARYFNYYLPNFVFHSYYNGVYGDVRGFNFPPHDHEMWGHTKEYGSRNYSVIAGMPQLKYDTNFPDPPADHKE